MQTITTIGLDIAKSVFQVHGVDVGGQVVIRRQLKRRYVLAFFQKLSPCLVGIFDKSIDVQVLRLRRKLEVDPSVPRMIRTERGVGYIFAVPVEPF